MTVTETRAAPGLPWHAKGWFWFMILGQAWTAYRLSVQIEDLVSHSDPRWTRDGLNIVLPALFGLSLLNILCLGLVLLRRKLGVYLFVASQIAAVGVLVFLGAFGPLFLLSLIGLAIFALLVQANWGVLR